jgi:hypothetical protein
VTSDESRISEQTRPDAARELGGLQIISNRPLAVSLPRPDGFLRLTKGKHLLARLMGAPVL